MFIMGSAVAKAAKVVVKGSVKAAKHVFIQEVAEYTIKGVKDGFTYFCSLFKRGQKIDQAQIRDVHEVDHVVEETAERVRSRY